MFSVSIDGSEAVECDAYAAVTEPEAKLFESKNACGRKSYSSYHSFRKKK